MAVHADPRARAPDSSWRGPQDYRRTAPESIAAPPYLFAQRQATPGLARTVGAIVSSGRSD